VVIPGWNVMNTKKLYCKHCTEEVIGQNNLARVYYKLEDDSIEEVYLVHEKCVKSFLVKSKGLLYKCPKCNGLGQESWDTLNLWTKEDGSMEVVWSSTIYKHPFRYTVGKFEKIKEKTKACSLCEGEGYLEKEPIPVVTEWRKAS
jgi:hypothetical protein